jgi:hypothetical protein
MQPLVAIDQPCEQIYSHLEALTAYQTLHTWQFITPPAIKAHSNAVNNHGKPLKSHEAINSH